MLGSYLVLVALHGWTFNKLESSKTNRIGGTKSTNMENRLLVTDEAVDFEVHQDFKIITDQ